MKQAIMRTTFWVLCLFVYLVLSIQLFQSVKAQETMSDDEVAKVLVDCSAAHAAISFLFAEAGDAAGAEHWSNRAKWYIVQAQEFWGLERIRNAGRLQASVFVSIVERHGDDAYDALVDAANVCEGMRGE